MPTLFSLAPLYDGSVTTPKIANNAVTLAKTSMATGKLCGRSTAGTGAIEAITVGTGLSLSGGSLTNTGSNWIPVTTTTTSSSATAVNFTSLTAAKFFKITCRVKGNNASNQYCLRYNSDSGANYTYLRCNATTAAWALAASTTQTQIILGAKNNAAWTTITILIDGASGAMTMTPYGYENSEIAFSIGSWNTATTITDISFFCNTGNFADGSIIALEALY